MNVQEPAACRDHTAAIGWRSMAPPKRRSTKIKGDANAGALTAADPATPSLMEEEQRVIAVTGAYSFLGSRLIQQLEQDRRYYKILALDIRKPQTPLHKTQFHRVDLTMPTADSELSQILIREGVDTLVHAAFLSEPTHQTAWAHELESIGTLHVLAAAAAAKVKNLIVWSQTLVYGAHPSNPNYLNEDHPLRGEQSRSRYVRDKAETEKQIRRFRSDHPACNTMVLRTAPILGPTIRNWVSRFFCRPIAPVMMGYDPLIQLVHERDVVEVFTKAVAQPMAGEFNIVGPGVLPYSMVLGRLGRVRFPLPYRIAYSLSRLLWATQVYDTPPNFLDFLRYMCVADGAQAEQQLGFVGRYDVRQILDDFLGVYEPPDHEAQQVRGERSDESVFVT